MNDIYRGCCFSHRCQQAADAVGGPQLTLVSTRQAWCVAPARLPPRQIVAW